ncbi:MAG: Si-specific NAD(P)(+) transhydrogenase [Acidimicrobiia bacterium]
MAEFDMVVIGSGPAGEKAAAQAAYFGKRVAIVERAARPGGAPVNTGGIPTKTLRETAQYLTGFRRREVYGVGIGLGVDVTVELLHARSAEVSQLMADAVLRNINRHRIELVYGEASLDSERAVVIKAPDGSLRSLSAHVVLIATGSRPFHAPGIPFDDPDVHDSESILDIETIPGRLVVIGGGPVGSEYASIFTALGSKVTLIDAGERLMPFLDAEISELVSTIFGREGMDVILSSSGTVVERAHDSLQVMLPDGRVLLPDKVLFAAGRSANTDGLGLLEAGVTLDGRGHIVVDEDYQTATPGVYAAGDVIGPPALASVSAEQGRVAACHAFGIPFKQTVDPSPPFGVYSIPEIGMVGMTEEAAATAGIDHEVGRAWFEDNPRSCIAGMADGLIKLVFRRDDRRLLGVHVVGEEAAELVHQGQAVIQAGETIDRFIHSTYNIPTRSEAYKYAAYDGLQRLSGHPVESGPANE